MTKKDSSKKSSTKSFSKADVKNLYEAIKYGWRDSAISLAFAASGSFKISYRSNSHGNAISPGEHWPMRLAIEKEDLELLEAFRPYVDITQEQEEIGASWFDWAWRTGRKEVAALFVSWLPDFKDEDGALLRRAAANGSLDLLDLALPVSDPNARGDQGENALMSAAYAMNTQAVQRLLPLTNPDAVDDKGRDALMHALSGLRSRSDTHGFARESEIDLKCFQSLVDACGVHRKDASGMAAISMVMENAGWSHAARWKCIPTKFVDILLSAGARGGNSVKSDVGPLMTAIDAGNQSVFDLLLPSTSLIQVDGEGLTPLLRAAKLGRSQMVALLAPLSDCNVRAPDGSTALMFSAQCCDLRSVRLLCALSDRSLRDSKGRTATHIAAENLVRDKSERNELLTFIRLFDPATAKGQGFLPYLVGIAELLEAALPFCDPNEWDSHGRTALHCAIELRDSYAFELLLPITNVKTADGSGNTPLILSARADQLAMCQALIPLSDAKAKGTKGWTALMYAVQRANGEMVEALIPVSDVKAADDDGVTALMLAAENHRLAMVKALTPGSDVNAVDKYGKNALIYATQGHTREGEELLCLLADRTDFSAMDEGQRTVLNIVMKQSRFPQGAATKIRGMMNTSSERDDLSNFIEEPKNASGKRKMDAFYAAPKVKNSAK